MAKEKKDDLFELSPEEQKALAAEKEGMQLLTPKLFVHRPEIEEHKIPITGILMGRRVVDFDDDKEPSGKRAQTFYIVALTAPAVLIDDDKKPFKAKAGDFALVCERYDLRILSRYMPVTKPDDKGVAGVVNYTKVMITPLKQEPIKGGKKVWKFDVRAVHVDPETVKLPALLVPATAEAALPSNLLDEARGEVGNDDNARF